MTICDDRFVVRADAARGFQSGEVPRVGVMTTSTPNHDVHATNMIPNSLQGIPNDPNFWRPWNALSTYSSEARAVASPSSNLPSFEQHFESLRGQASQQTGTTQTTINHHSPLCPDHATCAALALGQSFVTPYKGLCDDQPYLTPDSGNNSSFNTWSTDSFTKPHVKNIDMDSFTPDTYVFPSPVSSFGPERLISEGPPSSPCPQPPSRQLYGQHSMPPQQSAAQSAPRSFHPAVHEDIKNYATPHREAQRFRPMDALLCPSQGYTRSSNEFGAWKLKQMEAAMKTVSLSSTPSTIPSFRPNNASFSTRYGGQHIESNASADHLLPVENCALWLTNLPPRISYNKLLGSIRGFGRIWCTYINEPDSYEHVTAAAKVVFFKPKAATAFLKASWVPETPLMIDGYRIKVSHNRIKYPEKMHDHDESRVLMVTGHPKLVNEKTLTEFFENRFMFQMDRVRMLAQSDYRNVLEFSFGSYRCQAQMAKLALEKDQPEGFEKAEYAEDPCEIAGESWAAWHVAAERIAGIGL